MADVTEVSLFIYFLGKVNYSVIDSQATQKKNLEPSTGDYLEVQMWQTFCIVSSICEKCVELITSYFMAGNGMWCRYRSNRRWRTYLDCRRVWCPHSFHLSTTCWRSYRIWTDNHGWRRHRYILIIINNKYLLLMWNSNNKPTLNNKFPKLQMQKSFQ